jgi:hypothetical protein
VGCSFAARRGVDDDNELVSAMDYFVADYPTGGPVSEVTDLLNSYGADGWSLNSLEMLLQNKRRAVFEQVGAMVEYLVVDYDAGLPASQLEADLDGYGVDGWSLTQVDMLNQNKRRAILTKGPASSGGGGGGIEEAPLDGTTYGRRNASWQRELDGGSF